VKYRNSEFQPDIVPGRAKQEGDIRDRWSWVEPSVWTERMLAALEKGVKGNKWFSLIDKVYSMENLQASARAVIRNKGSAGADHQTVEMFATRISANLLSLQRKIKDDTWKPGKIRRVWIPKPGRGRKMRPLGIPTIRDRVVQTALRNVIEPIFENEFAEHSYGFRPGRGCKDALRRVDQLLKAGYGWVVDADIAGYFDSISHDKLMLMIEEKIADGRVLKLVRQYLEQEIMETAGSWTPERGTPQGAIISPLLSNIFLDPLDKLMAKRGYEMVRYADDFVVLCKSEEEAQKALREIAEWINTRELSLHPDKTGIIDTSRPGGFNFLGYYFYNNKRRPSRKSRDKLRDTLRMKTRRSNGNSLEYIIIDVNITLKGWFNYFQHSNKWSLLDIDRWVRMRLRSILRKRAGLKGRGRGRDHQRWTNDFFAQAGLFSMMAAWTKASQSVKR